MNFAIVLNDGERYAQCDATSLALKLKDLIRVKEKLDPMLVKEIVEWIEMKIGQPLTGINLAATSEQNMITPEAQRSFRLFMDIRGNIYFEDFLAQYTSDVIHVNRLLSILGG